MWSSDEQMMLYLWMVPFLKSSPGGSQESIIDLELVALKVMFSGIPVYACIKKISSQHPVSFISKPFHSGMQTSLSLGGKRLVSPLM